jgi:hypothetical protein
MAIIPSEPRMLSMDVPAAPDASVGAGLVGQSLANVGRQVAESASNLYVQVRHQEAESVVLDTYLKQQDQARQFLEQAKLRSKDGNAYDENGVPILNPADGSQMSLTDYYKQWSDQKYRDTQQSLPSPYAQELYQQKMGTFFSGFKNDVWNEEMSKRIDFLDGIRNDGLRREAVKQVETPNVPSFYENLDLQRANLKNAEGKTYTPAQVRKRDEQMLKDFPDALMQGFETQITSLKNLEASGAGKGAYKSSRIEAGVNAIATLTGQDPESIRRRNAGMPVLADLMDPDKKSHWLNKFNMLLEVGKQHDTSDWSERGDRIALSLEKGEKGPDGMPLVSDSDVQRFYQEGIALKNAGAVKDLKFLDTLSNIAVKKNSGQFLNSADYFFLSPERKQAAMNKIADDSVKEVSNIISKNGLKLEPGIQAAGAPARERALTLAKELMLRADTEIHDDLPKTIAQKIPTFARNENLVSYTDPRILASPGVQAAARSNDQQLANIYRSYNGDPNANPPAYLSKAKEQELGNFLTGPANSDQKLNMLLGVHALNPATYNSKINQMIQSNKLPPRWYVALSIGDDKVFATEMVNAITNPIKEPQSILGTGNSVDVLKSDIFDKSRDYMASIISRNPQSPITNLEQGEIRDTLFNMAINRIVKGQSTASTAADDVVKALVDNRFMKTKVSRGVFSSSDKIMFPKRIGGVELSDIDKSNIEQNLQAYKDPSFFSALTPDRPDGLDPRIENSRVSEVMTNSLKFRWNATQDKLIPQWEDSYHGGVMNDVLRNKKPIEIDPLDLRHYLRANDPGYLKFGRKALELGGKAIDAGKSAVDAMKNAPPLPRLPKEPF